jgi:hypothetical protein
MSEHPGSDAAATAAGISGSWFDPELVARDAMSKDPGLDSGLALRLAKEAGSILADDPNADGPEVARKLLVDNRETGATPANCIAAAAVSHRLNAGPSPR